MNDPGSLIRTINIATITDTHHPIIDWFNDLWSQIHKVEVDVFNQNGEEFIYYIIDPVANRKIAIFYLGRQVRDSDQIYLSCSKDNYWSVLWNKLNQESYYSREHEYTLVNEITQILLGYINDDMLINRVFGPYTLDSICDVNVKTALKQL
jgi:hypothetical protein